MLSWMLLSLKTGYRLRPVDGVSTKDPHCRFVWHVMTVQQICALQTSGRGCSTPVLCRINAGNQGWVANGLRVVIQRVTQAAPVDTAASAVSGAAAPHSAASAPLRWIVAASARSQRLWCAVPAGAQHG
ncbi:MAG: hypothetical protein ACJ8AI_30280, partial [Rhodopila sp.]